MVMGCRPQQIANWHKLYVFLSQSKSRELGKILANFLSSRSVLVVAVGGEIVEE